MSPHERVWLGLRTGNYRADTDAAIAADLESKHCASWNAQAHRFETQRTIAQVREAFPSVDDVGTDVFLIEALRKAERSSKWASGMFWLAAIAAVIGWAL